MKTERKIHPISHDEHEDRELDIEFSIASAFNREQERERESYRIYEECSGLPSGAGFRIDAPHGWRDDEWIRSSLINIMAPKTSRKRKQWEVDRAEQWKKIISGLPIVRSGAPVLFSKTGHREEVRSTNTVSIVANKCLRCVQRCDYSHRLLCFLNSFRECSWCGILSIDSGWRSWYGTLCRSCWKGPGGYLGREFCTRVRGLAGQVMSGRELYCTECGCEVEGYDAYNPLALAGYWLDERRVGISEYNFTQDRLFFLPTEKARHEELGINLKGVLLCLKCLRNRRGEGFEIKGVRCDGCGCKLSNAIAPYLSEEDPPQPGYGSGKEHYYCDTACKQRMLDNQCAYCGKSRRRKGKRFCCKNHEKAFEELSFSPWMSFTDEANFITEVRKHHG